MGLSNYFSKLSSGELSHSFVNEMLDNIRDHLTVKPVPTEVLNSAVDMQKITDKLSKLPLYIVTGHKSWSGLAVCFPGTGEDLKTSSISTPYIREILYPILDLHKRIQNYDNQKYSCIYIIGKEFSDVLLRKFRLLEKTTPNLILLTQSILELKNSVNKLKPVSSGSKIDENYIQKFLCATMLTSDGYPVSLRDGDNYLRYISHEVETYEGTQKHERLDILGYAEDGSLVAFEIKGLECNRVQLENLYLQGIEHHSWLESNKMAVKLLFEGPNGRKINTRKRARLILGFSGDKIPELFQELRSTAEIKDKHLTIDYQRLSLEQDGSLNSTPFQDDIVLDCFRLIKMVQVLHRKGYELLRIAPSVSPSGLYWRCSFVPAINIDPEHGALEGKHVIQERAIYSSSERSICFGWKHAHRDTPEMFADKFIEKFPQIAKSSLGKDPEYCKWYDEMVSITSPNNLIYAYADWNVPADYLPVLTNDDIKVPMPPLGHNLKSR